MVVERLREGKPVGRPAWGGGWNVDPALVLDPNLAPGLIDSAQVSQICASFLLVEIQEALMGLTPGRTPAASYSTLYTELACLFQHNVRLGCPPSRAWPTKILLLCF